MSGTVYINSAIGQPITDAVVARGRARLVEYLRNFKPGKLPTDEETKKMAEESARRNEGRIVLYQGPWGSSEG